MPTALDIRALQAEFSDSLYDIVQQELAAVFGHAMSASQLTALARKIRCTVDATLEKTSTMDAEDRMKAVTAATTSIFVDFFNDLELASTAFTVSSIGQFRSNVESRGVELLGQLRRSFLLGERGVAPASPYLNKTRAVYEYVRVSLGVHMHGAENLHNFDGGLGASGEPTIGQNIAKIYEVCFFFPLFFMRFIFCFGCLGYSRRQASICCSDVVWMKCIRVDYLSGCLKCCDITI